MYILTYCRHQVCWIQKSNSHTIHQICYLLDLLGNKLTSNDLGRVLDEVLDVSAHWYPLGLQLQVRISTLDGIRIQFQNPRDQLLEMLKVWLTTSDNTSWKTLTDALRSRSVGASQLARVLEIKYCLVEETEVVQSSQPMHAVTLPTPVSQQMVPTLSSRVAESTQKSDKTK